MNKSPRPYTKKEVKEMLLKQIHVRCEYWAKESRTTNTLEKLQGLAFSILVLLDGDSLELPKMDLVLRPHPSDKEFCEKEWRNWFKDGMIINADSLLHDDFYEKRNS